MKLKMHSKISPNSQSPEMRKRRGGAKRNKGEIANGGEEERALGFKTIMLQLVTMAL